MKRRGYFAQFLWIKHLKSDMEVIKRTTVTAQAIEAIREYLTSGEFSPGDKLATESELAAMLGVGRSTVREAIRTLEAMGYVELRPGKGAFARIVSEADAAALSGQAKAWFTASERTLEEFVQLRRLLEPAAAAFAAKSCSDAGKQELKAALSAFSDALSKADPAALAAEDRHFHTVLVRESGNRLLYQFYQQTESLFTAYSIRSFTASGETAPLTLEEHRRVLQAVLDGEPEAAQEAMQTHLQIAETRIGNMIRSAD